MKQIDDDDSDNNDDDDDGVTTKWLFIIISVSLVKTINHV